MPGYKQKCGYCRKKFYLKIAFDLHEDACFEQYEAEQRQLEDAASEELQEFTDAGFTKEQAQFLMSKYGSNT